MGRSKAPKAPAYKPTEIRYGDQVVGKTYLDPATNSFVSQFIPDAAEQQRKQIVQQKINDIMSTLGRTAPELDQQYTDTENSFVQDATSKFMEQYEPTVRNLREDIASRFGSLNSSQFLNGLNDLEKNKASAFADIVNRGKTLKYNLVNQDETGKLQMLNALGSMLNSDQANMLTNTQSSVNAGNAINDFLNSQWMTKLKDYQTNSANSQKNLRDGLMLALSLASKMG